MVFKTTKQLKGSKHGDIPEGRAGYYRWYHPGIQKSSGSDSSSGGNSGGCMKHEQRNVGGLPWICRGKKDCIQIPLSGAWSVADGFGAVSVEISEPSLLVKDMKEWSGFAFLLKQN